MTIYEKENLHCGNDLYIYMNSIYNEKKWLQIQFGFLRSCSTNCVFHILRKLGADTRAKTLRKSSTYLKQHINGSQYMISLCNWTSVFERYIYMWPSVWLRMDVEKMHSTMRMVCSYRHIDWEGLCDHQKKRESSLLPLKFVHVTPNFET